MKILVISDTHGELSNLELVIRILGPDLDFLIHLGDGARDLERLPRELVHTIPHLQVKGNMDSDARLPPSRVTEAGGHRLYLSHGHAALASGSPLPMILAAREAGASACLFGHTHVPHKSYSDGLLVLNPGSLSRPRNGRSPSFALLTVPDNGTGRIEAGLYEILDGRDGPSFYAIDL